MLAIVEGYSRGTRYGIRMDADGLLAAGEPGVQLTWMDAKFGDWVVTPRIGKPVEVQALWLNALWIAARIDAAVESRFRTRPRGIRTPLLERRRSIACSTWSMSIIAPAKSMPRCAPIKSSPSAACRWR